MPRGCRIHCAAIHRAYRTGDCKSDRLVGVSDLWRIMAPKDECISGKFALDKFALALWQMELGRAPES